MIDYNPLKNTRENIDGIVSLAFTSSSDDFLLLYLVILDLRC